jgi:hypothetical protein
MQLTLAGGNLLFGAVLGAGFGLVLFFRGFIRLRTFRRIENTPTSRVRSLPMGSVELCGTAETDESMLAPFSGKDAAYWELEIERYQGGKNSRWVTVHRETSTEPFRVNDGTGRILVLPDGAESHLREDYCERFQGWSALPTHLESFLEGAGVRRGLFGGMQPLRFTEHRVDVGGPVYVYGVAQDRPDLRREQTQRVTERLREFKADPERMQSFDVDGDGQISDLEWERARRQETAAVRDEGVEDRVVIARGETGEMFLISDRDEKALIRGLRWEAIGCVFGGLALSVGCTVYAVMELQLL